MSTVTAPERQKPLGAFLEYDTESDKFINFRIPNPLSVCYKVTRRCNLTCPYCIASSSPKATYGLPTHEAKRILKTIKDAGVVRVDITGGEPFIRDDIVELLQYSVDIGLETVVTTNGYFINDDKAAFLAECGIFTQVSIDGPEEFTDKVRGKGTFRHAANAVATLVKHRVPVRINCVIQRNNVEYMERTTDIAKGWGAGSVYFIVVCAQGRANKLRDKFCFTSVEEHPVREKIQELREKSGINVKMLDFRQYTRACVLVDTFGEFISQGWSDEECITTGNILESDLKELWQKSGAFDHAIHLLQYTRHPILYK